MPMTYFTEQELACKCGCGKADMDPAFMAKLNEIRRIVARPFAVTSAYRCPDYNDQVSKTGRNGPHTTGRAIDIRADSRLRYEIMAEARNQGITRFGIARTFIHIDDLTEAAGFDGRVIWTY